MDEKETVLRQFVNNYGHPITDYDLIYDLQAYGISQAQAHEVVNECLSEGYITISNQKLSITSKGRKYLKNSELMANYTRSAAQVFNSSDQKDFLNIPVKKRSLKKVIELWAAVIGIIGGILTIYYLLSDHKVW